WRPPAAPPIPQGARRPLRPPPHAPPPPHATAPPNPENPPPPGGANATPQKAPPAEPAEPKPAVKPARPVEPAKFVTRIQSHPQLVSRLQPLIPSDMTLQTAAASFRNQGQFFAALHVAHNHNIRFADLKALMMAPNNLSLGQALHRLQPTTNSKTAVRVGEREAHEDLEFEKVKTPHAKPRENR